MGEMKDDIDVNETNDLGTLSGVSYCYTLNRVFIWKDRFDRHDMRSIYGLGLFSKGILEVGILCFLGCLFLASLSNGGRIPRQPQRQ